MMRSLSSAVTGLRSHQTKMDVIGNNIANVNTNGFKASRTTFADVYYQNLSGSKAGVQGSSGGTNPTQIGYGASVATVDVLNTVTGASSTDRALDVYITGEGFLVSKDAAGQLLYSRLGNLGFDAAGNLIDGSGNLIMGFPTDASGKPTISADGTILADQLQSINCSPEILEKLKEISINNSGAIIGLLEGDPVISAQSQIPDWINGNNMSIPTTSVYNGPVNFALSGFCTTDVMAAALGVTPTSAVTGIEMGSLALPKGDYKVSISEKGVVTLFRDATPTEEAVSLTGTLKNGQLVLSDKRGNVGLTISIDKDAVPSLTSTMGAGTAASTVINDGQNGTDVEYATGSDANLDASGNPYADITGTVKGVPDNGDNLADISKPLYIDVGLATGSTDFYIDDQGTLGVPDKVEAVNEDDPDRSDEKIYWNDGGTWKVLTDGGGKEMYAKKGTTIMPLTDADDNQLYASYSTTTTPATAGTDQPNPLALEYYYQMKTTDKGGNALSYPATPAKFDENTTYPWKVAGLDELSLEIFSDPTEAFNGIIGTAGPGESESFVIGNLVMAKFRNANGLQQTGTSYFSETSNSGQAEFVVPGLSGTGALKAGYLEMSNVDVSKEFTDMITTQRGFQANSRIITVSDEMLQELVNLKR